MKADEVLRRYAAGERDFRRVNLRGQSFKGKNLSGADFSEADIRGANFTNACLRGVKLYKAKAGLQRQEAASLVLVSWLISGLSGFVSAITGAKAGSGLTSEIFTDVVVSFISLLLFAVFCLFLRRQGWWSALGIWLFAWSIAAAFSLGSIWSLTQPNDLATSIDWFLNWALTIVGAFAVVWAWSLTWSVGGDWTLVIAIAWFWAGTLVFAPFLANNPDGVDPIAATIGSVSMILTIAGMSAYVSWHALAGNEKYAFVRSVTIASAANEGTSLCNADLTEADFTSATLKSTDFRGANLTRTCWRNAQKLDCIRPGMTYLQDAKVQQLLITGQGQDQNFDRQNLRGVNLQGANLADASFIGTDLSEANLQDADLSRAKLVQTQLDETDLTGATLTGAFIEDWGITSHTKLHSIKCRYVFMRLPTKDDPEPRRKPDNREEEFEDGNFADFIKPIVDTLDLYHNQRVDPRAIAISFKHLAENNPDAKLEIVAMEKRGQDKFLLRAATAPNADRSALSAEYFTTYNQIKALAEAEVQAILAEKDSRISSLENMVETALQRPSFYAQTYKSQGDTMSQAPKKYTKNDFRSASFAGGFVDADTVYAQHIGGTINNYPPEQRQNLAEAAAEIQQLLQQLEQSYPNATEIEKQSALAVTLQQEIKQNPTFKARLKNALKEGGIEALKVLFAPIGIPIEMVRGWIEAEAE